MRTKLQELIARGEGVDIEFKAASAGVHDDVFETVCSFANGQGGDMFLGVNDHGQVVGLSREALDGIKRDVNQACSANGLFTKAVPVGVQELVLNRHHIVHIRVPRIRCGVAYKGNRYVRRGDADFKVGTVGAVGNRCNVFASNAFMPMKARKNRTFK